MLEPGERIGDWIVDERLGEGGMGAVFHCHNTLSDAMKAAVKVLKAKEVSQGRERFVQELQTLASLSHPGIVRVLGGGEDRERDLLFLVMELVTGDALSTRLEKGPLPPGDAVALALRLAQSLAYAHESGVFHRDVKPSNVMLAADGAKLIDFGIARAANRGKLTVAGTVTGTMAYLPPESFQVDEPDPAAADVYALGITLHEALTASHPFGDDTTSSASLGRLVALKLGSKAMDPGPAFGQDLRELVKAATSPDPATRTPSMAAFAEGLAALGIPASRPGQPSAKPPMTVSARRSQEIVKEALEPAPKPEPPKPEPVKPEPVKPEPVKAEEPPKRDVPPPPPPPERSGGGGRTAMLVVGGLAVVLLFGLGAVAVVVGIGGLAIFGTKAPEQRTVEVMVDGPTPDAVTLDGKPLTHDASGWTIDLAPGTTGQLRLATGPGAATWSGGECPACTACAEQALTVQPGDGAQSVGVHLEAPKATPRDVHVQAPSVPGPAKVTFTLDGQPPASSDRGSATFAAVAPGAHQLVASTGTCAPADDGCTGRGSCAKGCASVSVPLDLTCGEGPQEASVPLTPPGAPPAPVPVVVAPTPRPPPVPAPPPVAPEPEPEPEPVVEPAPEPEPAPAPEVQHVTVHVIAPAATAGLLVKDATGVVQTVNTNEDVTVVAGDVVLQHGYAGPPVIVTISPGAHRVVCGTIDSCTVK